ncbi:MAG: hypothetical protein M0R17_05275 [Candidatus Omnitrophica bacterium]|jgi:hypothetical protein|nr:hypothetical protein [Candidatus Omnitrophota bacterium]
MSKSKYLVVCDGCGMPATVDNPQSFICKNCNYDLCTVQESPVHKDPKEPVIGKECADLLEEIMSGKFEF